MVGVNDDEGRPRIFVSYTDRDAHLGKELARALKEADVDTWHMRQRVRSAGSWAIEVDRIIPSCDAFALIYSGNTGTSTACLEEVAAALAAKVPILVVLVDDARLADGYHLRLRDLTPIAWQDPAEVAALVMESAELDAPKPVGEDGARRLEQMRARTRKATIDAIERLYEYEPDKFVERKQVSEAWSRYVESSKPTFALIGASGLGKSASMGSLASLVLKGDDLCLFYHGRDIGPSLLATIARDLGGGDDRLLASKPLDVVARRLKGSASRLYIFVDSLDSVTDQEGIRSELNLITHDLLILLQDAARPDTVRLVVSCTDGGWKTWSRQPGARHLNSLAVSTYCEAVEGQAEAQGVHLDRLEGKELAAAFLTYGINRPLSPQWQRLCGNAEVLTLVARRLATSAQALPQQASLRVLLADLVEEYFPDFDDQAKALDILRRIARAMLERGSPQVPSELTQSWDRDVLRRLRDANLVRVYDNVIKFQSDVIAEQLIGQQIYRDLFSRDVDDAAARVKLAHLCSPGLELMPGALIAAFHYSAEMDGSATETRFTSLLRCLIDMEAKWVVVAALALKEHGAPMSVIKPLIETVCRSDSYAVRATVARVLSERRAWRELVPTNDWRSREVAALARLNDRVCTGETCTELWAFADDPHWRVRRAAGYGLERLWASCDAHGGTSLRIRDDGTLMTWRQAHGTLIALAGKRSRSKHEVERGYLMSCAVSDNRQLRWLVAYYLPRYSRLAFEQLMSAFHEEPDAWVRATFAQSVVKLANSSTDFGEIDRLLSSLCADPDPDVRVRIARALGTARNENLAERHLRPLVSDDDPRVQAAARYALATYPGLEESESSIPGPLDPRNLVERIALQDTDVTQFERRQKVSDQSLHEFSEERLTIAFVDDPYVKSFETMRALLEWSVTQLRHKDPSQVAELLRLLIRDPDEGMRWSLVLCLLDPRTPLTPAEVATCVEALQRDAHMWVRRELVTGLPLLARRHIVTWPRVRAILAGMRDQLADEPRDFVEEVEPFLVAALAEADQATAVEKQPLDLIWSLTLVCPWDCAMCCVDAVHVSRSPDGIVLRSEGLQKRDPYPVGREAEPDIYEFAARVRQQQGLELNLNQKLQVLDHLDGFDAKIDFSGGDPMVQRENLVVMREAARRFGRENVTLTATGAGLARLEVDELAPIIGELNFTYDSPSSGVPGLRPNRYAQGNLQRAAAFAAAGVSVRAECPLTTENSTPEMLTAIFDSLREARIPRLLVMRLFPSGRGAQVADRTPDPQRYAEAVAHLRGLERDRPGPRVRLQCALRHLEGGDQGEPNPCDLVHKSYGLLVDGTLLASPWATDGRGQPFSEEWVLGNLATNPMATILDGPKARSYRSRLDENFGHCKIFSFLNSEKTGADRLFDRTDPLYVDEPVD